MRLEPSDDSMRAYVPYLAFPTTFPVALFLPSIYGRELAKFANVKVFFSGSLQEGRSGARFGISHHRRLLLSTNRRTTHLVAETDTTNKLLTLSRLARYAILSPGTRRAQFPTLPRLRDIASTASNARSPMATDVDELSRSGTRRRSGFRSSDAGSTMAAMST